MTNFSNDNVELIVQGIVASCENLRGKDFARKQNLHHGVTQTKTTRSTLGTINYLLKTKKDMRLKKEKGEPKDLSAPVEQEGQLTDKAIDRMKVSQLWAALKALGFQSTGIKANLWLWLKASSADIPVQQKRTIEESTDVEIPD